MKSASSLLSSHFLEAGWYEQLGGEGTLADAIMSRISCDSYKINITSIGTSRGISVKEIYGLNPAAVE